MIFQGSGTESSYQNGVEYTEQKGRYDVISLYSLCTPSIRYQTSKLSFITDFVSNGILITRFIELSTLK